MLRQRGRAPLPEQLSPWRPRGTGATLHCAFPLLPVYTSHISCKSGGGPDGVLLKFVFTSPGGIVPLVRAAPQYTKVMSSIPGLGTYKHQPTKECINKWENSKWMFSSL